MTLTFVSGNRHKAASLQRYLGVPIEWVNIDLPEIQSLDVQKVAAEKAKEAYRRLQRTVLVEDFSVKFEGLNGFPGPLIKWFTESLSTEEISDLLKGKSRGATVEIVFALARSAERASTYTGVRDGTIVDRVTEEGIYKMMELFQPEGANKTWSEMTDQEQMQFSVRRLACETLLSDRDLLSSGFWKACR